MFHGVVTNIVLRSGYKPGPLTAVVGVALRTYYVWHDRSSNLASDWDRLGAVLLLPAFVVVVMLNVDARLACQR